MEPLFNIDDQIGLEAPPAAEPQARAAVGFVCPNCGCKDPAVAQADAASVVTCPQCQCEFDHPEFHGNFVGPDGGTGAELSALELSPDLAKHLVKESSATRVLGRIFERHFRRQHRHGLKRVSHQQGQPKQTQPKLPDHAP